MAKILNSKSLGRAVSVAVAVALCISLGLVNAQSNNGTSAGTPPANNNGGAGGNPSPNDINGVAESTRQAWCTQQVSICSNLCAASTKTNRCNFKDLGFDCTCSNGTSPTQSANVDQTIPFFKCTAFQWQPCINACTPGDQACQDKCNSQFECGKVKRNPNATTTTDPSKPTTTPSTGLTVSAAPRDVVPATHAAAAATLAAVGTLVSIVAAMAGML